jgi:glucosamine-6-phosphate deaminase
VGRVTVLFGDERGLPPRDPETNDQIANESLLRIACPATVHRIPGELGPEEPAAFYEPIVAATPLDLVMLGIGTDGTGRRSSPTIRRYVRPATSSACGTRRSHRPSA